MPVLPLKRQRIARFLLILFSMMVVNSIVFRHAHKLPSGRVIVHAHPYIPLGKSPYQPNTHTSNELFWLDTVTNALYDGVLPFAFAFAVLALSTDGVLPMYGRQTPLLPFYCFSHRGPPAAGINS